MRKYASIKIPNILNSELIIEGSQVVKVVPSGFGQVLRACLPRWRPTTMD